MSRLLRVLAGLALTVCGTVVLAPTELPSSSPLTGSSELATAMATFALRVLATCFCGYLALVLLALALLEVRLLPKALRRRIDRWTSAGLAGAARQVVGASMLAAGVLPMTPAAHAAEAPPPVLAPMNEPASGTEPPRMTPAQIPQTDDRPTHPPLDPPDGDQPTAPVEPPRMTPLDDRPTQPPPTRPPGPRTPLPPAAEPPTTSPRMTPAAERPTQPPSRPPRIELPPAGAEHPNRHVLPRTPSRSGTSIAVQPGDSFWSITEDLVTLRLGRAPTDKEVIGPWLDLIARNTQVLADPDDPDLLHPGAILHLPPRRAR